MKITPYRFQREAFRFLNANKKVKIWLCGRQMGKNLITAVTVAYKLLKPNTNICVVIPKTYNNLTKNIYKEAVKDIARKCDLDIVTDQKYRIELLNGSRVLFFGESDDGMFRGQTFTTTVLEEFYFWENPSAAWSWIYPVIASRKDSEVIIPTTGKLSDRSDFFTSLCLDHGYLKHVWEDHPDRDDEWRDKQIKYMGEEWFNLEYECR